MHSNQNRFTCETCSSSRKVMFCRECTHLSCHNCTVTREKSIWKCTKCNNKTNGEFCGMCGSASEVIDTIKEFECPSCKSTKLGDPKIILANLDSDFFSIITAVSDVEPIITETHRKFDFFVTLVRLCRLAGFVGFPQIEQHLQKCSEGLKEITKRGVSQLKKIQGESLYFLRQISYFRNIELEHFRNAEAILDSTSKSIKQLNEMLEHWLTEVNDELDRLMLFAEPLRQHYELLNAVKKSLPTGVHSIAAIIPPHSIKVNYKNRKKKMTAYLVFTDTELLFIGQDGAKQKRSKVSSTFRVPFGKIRQIKTSNSVIRGSELEVKTVHGSFKLIAPSVIVEGISGYFDLVNDKENYIIGSPKDIIEIESKTPDKNKFSRSVAKFTELIRSNMFDDEKKTVDDQQFKSLTELKDAIRLLEQKSREIDNQAINMQIDPDRYREKRSIIKDSFFSIRDNLANLGGHILNDSLDDFAMPAGEDIFNP